MKYPGSKARLAKKLLPIILEHRKNDRHLYIEPFVGGCNMMDKIAGNRWGNDLNKYIHALWRALQTGWIPDHEISEEKYYDIKINSHKYPLELVAHVAVNCSFGGKWFGGYARGKSNKGEFRNYAAEGMRHLLKQSEKLKGVRFTCKHYKNMKIPEESIIYCDPPYKNTIKYKDGFNHDEFWHWVRKISKNNYVYVSEYIAPKDFQCILEVEHKTTIDLKQHDKRIERLFVLK